MIKSDWELVHAEGAASMTHRLVVPGGWLFRHVMRMGLGKDSHEAMSITFVPLRAG